MVEEAVGFPEALVEEDAVADGADIQPRRRKAAMTEERPPRLILVAQAAGAFGVKGEVRITAFTEDPAALLRYAMLKREDGAPP